MMRTLALLLACLWLPAAAQAATLSGATLPDTYVADGQTLVLNGVGLRTLTIFRVKAYIAGLYLQRPSHDAQQILASPGIKVIVLKFLHSGSKEQIEKQFREGEAKNCGYGGCAKSDQADFEKLVAANAPPLMLPSSTCAPSWLAVASDTSATTASTSTCSRRVSRCGSRAQRISCTSRATRSTDICFAAAPRTGLRPDSSARTMTFCTNRQ